MAVQNTYTALDKVTIGTATPSITFNSIPSIYTDLVLVVCTKNAVQLDSLGLRFNSDATSNYSNTGMSGNGSTATSYRQTNQSELNIGLISTNDAINIISIANYSNSNTYKTAISRANVAADMTRGVVGVWRSNSAITSITVKDGSGNNMSVGSTFSLYGIAAWVPEATPKATGGVVTSDATYWYHTFTNSDNFVPNQTVTCDYLIVAGGGGGGPFVGGGGGAGGYRPFTSTSIAAGTYPVVVGAGGAGGYYGGPSGTSKVASTGGSASTFNGASSAGGGRGAYLADGSFLGPATAGGSGGGGSRDQAAGAGNSPSTSPVQGYAGGTGQGAPYYNPGGGGGAGGVGSNAGTSGGNGGPGLNWLSLGTYYAGGGGASAGDQGGAGTGGIGGGGNGTTVAVGTSGAYGTGGGGGGGLGTGGLGGGGIVIVRYAK